MAKKITPNPKAPRVRHFIREWRKKKGFTQERLATAMEVSSGLISQLETGETGYSQGTLENIAHVLNLPAGDLISRDPQMDEMLVELMRLIEEKGADTVLNVIKALPNKTGTNG